MQISELIAEYILNCEIQKFSHKTISGYKNNLAYLERFLSEKHHITEIEKVKSIHLKDFFKCVSDKGRKETYLNELLKVFRTFFKYAVSEEYISSNPCEKIPWAKETMPLIRTFNDSEVKRMLAVYGEKSYLEIRNKTILYMLFDTGIRNYELCCLPMEAISSNAISIMGKGKKERQAAQSPYLAKMLMKYMRYRSGYFEYKNISNRLFLSRTGQPLTVEAVERIVKIAGEKANVRSDIRCSPHTCRHYFAQSQLKNGIDVYSLSRLMGHGNIMITQRYLNSMRDDEITVRSIKTSPLMNLL